MARKPVKDSESEDAAAATAAPKRRGSRKAVNAANLATLGAERLSELLMELADAQPATKRRLRMELAGEAGGDDLAVQIGKRLSTIEARRSRVHWRKYREFLRDLDLQRAMIAGRLAELDAPGALALMWRLVGMAPRLFVQVDDRKGGLEEVMRTAAADLGALADRVRPEPRLLADQVFEALRADTAEVLDGLVPALLPALGDLGAAALRGLIEGSAERRPRALAAYRDALRHIADHQRDPDAWAETVPARDRGQPALAAAIARRMLDAGRVDDALAALDKAAPRGGLRGLLDTAKPAPDELFVWEGVFLDVLDAAGREAEAQALRWTAFERDLSIARLRDHLRRLADFDDVEAEDRALAYVQAYPRTDRALAFLMAWPALPRAAALIEARADQVVDGDPDVITGYVRSLESRHPLAASLLLRGMVQTALRRGDREGALLALHEAASLAEQTDFGDLESHQDFESRVRRAGRF